MYKFSNPEHTRVTDLDTGTRDIAPGVWLWDRYQDWVASGGVTEPWRTTAEVLTANQKLMKDAIIGREEQRNSRKIEHPQIAGAFFKPSTKIDRIIGRSDELANADPLPVNGGAFDDIDDNPVPMTVGQLKKLRNAVIDREEANYVNRKLHVKEMMKLATPLTYDYSGGWS